ncbi:hypothetical protein ACFL59_06885 [Planctomycetota bacterium]
MADQVVTPGGLSVGRPHRVREGHGNRRVAPPRFLLWPAFASLFLFLGSWTPALYGTLFHMVISYRRGGRRHLLLSVLVCPFVVAPVVCFLIGTIGYATGTAVLMGHGLPGREYRNIDPQIRCGRMSLGCVTDGAEFLTAGANNLAIETLAGLFGSMPGGYSGPYPTRVEARHLLDASGSTVENTATDELARLLRVEALDSSHLYLLQWAETVKTAVLCESVVLVRAVRQDHTQDSLIERGSGRRHPALRDAGLLPPVSAGLRPDDATQWWTARSCEKPACRNRPTDDVTLLTVRGMPWHRGIGDSREGIAVLDD